MRQSYVDMPASHNAIICLVNALAESHVNTLITQSFIGRQSDESVKEGCCCKCMSNTIII